MKILGISPAKSHDPAAALMIDGKVVAAAEEERFTRIKHAFGSIPFGAAKFCLEKAGIEFKDLDAIAVSYSFRETKRLRWKYAWRMRRYPLYALQSIRRASRNNREVRRGIKALCESFGCKISDFKLYPVESRMADIAASYYFSGWDNAALMSVGNNGGFASVVLGEGREGKIIKMREFCLPDSLTSFYSLVTRHLGFEPNDGEHKTMAMSPYGDPAKADMSSVINSPYKGEFRVNEDFLWSLESMKKHKKFKKARSLSELFGDPRTGDGLGEPYTHMAAAAQKTLENIVLDLARTHLSGILAKTGGKFCFSGSAAKNVRLNRKVLEMPEVKYLHVLPSSGNAASALGAAAWTSNTNNERIEPIKDAYLGPEYSNEQIKEMLDKFRIPHAVHDNIEEIAAKLLSEGNIIGWFQGRMEFGPNALGNRSIIANPASSNAADEINERIKEREKWRPFSPAVLSEKASEIIGTTHPADNMTISFVLNKKWCSKVPQVLHVDGTARPQTVRADTNPRFHRLISEFEKLTGLPLVLNASLKKRGEPLVCSPKDALQMFYQSGLEYLVMGNFLIRKKMETLSRFQVVNGKINIEIS